MREPVVEVHTMIAAPAARVWRAMTGRHSALFPGTDVETDWKPGHPIHVSGEWQGQAFTDHGEIETVEPEKELSFTHWSGKDGEKRPDNFHVVRYRLARKGDSTEVTLTQFNDGRDTSIDAKTKGEFEKNWKMMLDGLKRSVEAE